MAVLPDPTLNLVNEGHYSFKVTAEPEVNKTGNSKWLIVKFDITDSEGDTRRFSDVFFPSAEKYHKLLLAAGAEPDSKGIPHLSNMDTRELIGVEFDGDIEHIADKKDPNKIRDTITNIALRGEKESKAEEEEDEVPFGKEEDEVPF